MDTHTSNSVRGRGAERMQDGQAPLVARGSGRHAGRPHQSILYHSIERTLSPPHHLANESLDDGALVVPRLSIVLAHPPSGLPLLCAVLQRHLEHVSWTQPSKPLDSCQPNHNCYPHCTAWLDLITQGLPTSECADELLNLHLQGTQGLSALPVARPHIAQRRRLFLPRGQGVRISH
ncbi:hypothetical protein E2C01_023987 [Portunus trituberculatus]|uniref:Uncharacterized protein n=1 Tax=Portunus trituberculatus TaxID=210409 RepID=A0A5B7EAQ2_PORTR|nr:hypothetical protein [Portunus trituberculatus]